MDTSNFRALITRVRSSDPTAAEELHRAYGDQLQRIVRVRMTDLQLRRQMDSMDVCQSVFADFFVRMAMGQFDISEPADLLKLLATMARNRVIHHAHKQKAARRDVRRNKADAVEGLGLHGVDETPSQIVASREMIQEFFGRLGADERSIAEQRRAGRTWDEIGTELGKSGEAIRKQYERTLQRVSDELGLEELLDR